MSQACITGVAPPFRSVPVTVLAYSSTVSSANGSASTSVRDRAVGVGPGSSTPTARDESTIRTAQESLCEASQAALDCSPTVRWTSVDRS